MEQEFLYSTKEGDNKLKFLTSNSFQKIIFEKLDQKHFPQFLPSQNFSESFNANLVIVSFQLSGVVESRGQIVLFRPTINQSCFLKVR